MPTTYAIPNGRTVMDATLWAGNSTAGRVITNQYGFYPDFVWVKDRSQPNRNRLQNALVGANKLLFSDSTDAEQTDEANGYVSAISSSGFTVASGSGGYFGVNLTGDNYVGWQWNAGSGSSASNTNGSIASTVSANTTAGFSIVTYTGDRTSAGNSTIGHGLGVAPSLVITKSRSNSSRWVVQHSSLGTDDYLELNTTAGAADSVSVGAGALPKPTSTVFYGSWLQGLNISGQTFVAYCWAPIAGFSQFGSYTGNGSSDGPFVYLGFRPKFLMYKRTDPTGNSWFIVDGTRNPYNLANYWLQANTNEVEQTDGAIDLLSNGYKIRGTGTGTNASGGTYIYIAFAENPFKYATAR